MAKSDWRCGKAPARCEGQEADDEGGHAAGRARGGGGEVDGHGGRVAAKEYSQDFLGGGMAAIPGRAS